MAQFPTPRNQQFRRLTVEQAEWISSPGGVYTVAPASVSNGISATLTNLLNNAGVLTAGGVLAWRLYDTDGRLVQGGDDAEYDIETLFYVNTEPAALSLAYAVMGVTNNGSSATFLAGATGADLGQGINYSGANPRPFSHFKVAGGASTPSNVGVAGGYAALAKTYSSTALLRGVTEYIADMTGLWESSATPPVYKFNAAINTNGAIWGASVPPAALRVFLGFGSFGGALIGNQPIIVDAYYRCTRIYGQVP